MNKDVKSRDKKAAVKKTGAQNSAKNTSAVLKKIWNIDT